MNLSLKLIHSQLTNTVSISSISRDEDCPGRYLHRIFFKILQFVVSYVDKNLGELSDQSFYHF